ncbi:hypothetical protein C8J57DRAFT_1251673 [Mycena rebaudengoi]|nr:hypothetical protein C8J57DRAFT_1251673 [Mycena rebaudengoi]
MREYFALMPPPCAHGEAILSDAAQTPQLKRGLSAVLFTGGSSWVAGSTQVPSWKGWLYLSASHARRTSQFAHANKAIRAKFKLRYRGKPICQANRKSLNKELIQSRSVDRRLTFARPPYQGGSTPADVGTLTFLPQGKKIVIVHSAYYVTSRLKPQLNDRDLQIARVYWSIEPVPVPIFASIISLINDRRLAAKKSPLGFLKPRLYSDGISGLNDITSGHMNIMQRMALEFLSLKQCNIGTDIQDLNRLQRRHEDKKSDGDSHAFVVVAVPLEVFHELLTMKKFTPAICLESKIKDDRRIFLTPNTVSKGDLSRHRGGRSRNIQCMEWGRGLGSEFYQYCALGPILVAAAAEMSGGKWAQGTQNCLGGVSIHGQKTGNNGLIPMEPIFATRVCTKGPDIAGSLGHKIDVAEFENIWKIAAVPLFVFG